MPNTIYLKRIALCLVVAAISIVTLLSLARPVSAEPSAPPVFLVDKSSDDAGGGACNEVVASDCSLRSAIQQALGNAGYGDIKFNSSFTITLSSTLPELALNGTTILAYPTQTVKINGNNVVANVFKISGSYVRLDGLRIYGSGSTFSNIWVTGAAQAVEIANNVIGDDDLGFIGSCGNSAVSYSGVYIDSTGVLTPGNQRVWIYGNHIKCNAGIPGDGVNLVGTDQVIIGANASGTAGAAQYNFIMLNDHDGVGIQSNATNNTIRNSALQYNDNNGLTINNSSNNVIFGNYMQVNQGHGVEINNTSTLNRIGCPAGGPNNATQRNVIQQNNGSGIHITDAGTNSNLVFCNWIGLGDLGLDDAGNDGNGVLIDNGARFNVIGATSAERNVIGGNDTNGVQISGSTTRDNVVAGNYIGVNISGTAAVSNTLSGVALLSGASLNTIGGNVLGNLNLIGGNGAYGVYIAGSGTATNTVINNDIGYNTLGGGLPLPNGSDGLTLQDNARANIIGDFAKANYIAYNQRSGIFAGSGANLNSIRVNAIFSNSMYGVILDGAGASLNALTRTLIYNNGFDGIGERNGAGTNIWLQVSIRDNGGLGIDKDASSDATNIATGSYPAITAINRSTGVISGTASNNALIELYLVAPDPSGLGEGKTFVASTVSNGSGNWSIIVSPPGGCYTAVETIGFIIYASSEFGPNSCRTFAPSILKN